MKMDRHFFAESLVVRLGIALGAIVLLALAATISATVFAELSTGKAAAINLAGSLRMQSYWITVQVLRSGDIGRPPAELQQAMSEFEARLHSPLLAGGIPSDSTDATRRAYDRVAATWSGTLKPEVARAVTEGAPARDAFVARMAAYVLDVDRLVYLLEHDLEQRIQALRLIQGAGLFAIVVVMFIALFLMHAQVIVPLGDLLQCARRVRVAISRCAPAIPARTNWDNSASRSTIWWRTFRAATRRSRRESRKRPCSWREPMYRWKCCTTPRAPWPRIRSPRPRWTG